MILPAKHLRTERSLLGLGAEVLRLLVEPKTVSRLWEEMQAAQERAPTRPAITFDWVVLALDLLNAMSVVELDGGLLHRVRR
jgi:hypothetical protein